MKKHVATTMKVIAEKDTFEKKEEVEVEVESMEVETMDKQIGWTE